VFKVAILIMVISVAVAADALSSGLETSSFILSSDTSSSTLVQFSFTENQGLYTLNQASGSLNNQANLLLFSLTGGAVELEAFLRQQRDRSTASILNSQSRDSIIGSFSGSQGIFMVNQSSGNLNDQSNFMFCSIGGVLLLSERELERESPRLPRGQVAEGGGMREDIIADSFVGASGVGILSQSSGNNNSICNRLGISLRQEVR